VYGVYVPGNRIEATVTLRDRHPAKSKVCKEYLANMLDLERKREKKGGEEKANTVHTTIAIAIDNCHLR
jgi:hypothetical protein